MPTLRRWRIVQNAALLFLAVAALTVGCGDSSDTVTTPVPSGTGVINLVAPGGCIPTPCVGSTVNTVQLVGPLTLSPFTLIFGVTSILPFVPSGGYLLTGATFQDSTNTTQACPDVRFTVAAGQTTRITFSITNDVCAVSVAGPA
jgi:hypothetical protein